MRVRLTVDEYIRLAGEGACGHRRVEQIEGEVSEIAPQGNPHAICITRAGVADYRIVGVANRKVEVRRNPHADPAGRHGWVYDPPVIYDATQSIKPLERPGVAIAVAERLPKLKV